MEFFPLDVTNFGPSIAKIQAAKPDYVWSALVGGAHISFYRQWAAAGMGKKIPMASTTFALGNEHIVLTPEEANGIVVCYNYFQELNTPVNTAFVERFTSASAPTTPISPASPSALTRGSCYGRRRSNRRNQSTG